MALTAQQKLIVNNWYVAATKGGAAAVKQGIINLEKVANRDEVQNTLLQRLKSYRAPVLSKTASKTAITSKTPTVSAPVKQVATKPAGLSLDQINKAIKAVNFFGQTIINRIAAGEVDKADTIAQYVQAVAIQKNTQIRRAMGNVLNRMRSTKIPKTETIVTAPAPQVDNTSIETTDPAEEDFVFDEPTLPGVTLDPVSLDPGSGDWWEMPIDFPEIQIDVTIPSGAATVASPSVPETFQVDTVYDDQGEIVEAPLPVKKAGGGLLAAAVTIGTILFLGG